MGTREDEGFAEFAAAYRSALVRSAFLLCGDGEEAHDLAQVTLIRVHRRWRSIQRSDDPMVYARRVLVNLAASWWRQRLRLRTTAVAVERPASADEFARLDQRDELWQAVRRLPPRTRAVLVLRYFEDLSEVEAARALGCSVGSVKSQASRGLERLRALLADDRDGVAAQPAQPVEVSP